MLSKIAVLEKNEPPPLEPTPGKGKLAVGQVKAKKEQQAPVQQHAPGAIAGLR